MSLRSGTGPRAFLVGETVHLTTRVSLPGTKTPTDPATVELASLALNGIETLDAPVPFVRLGEGDYALDLQTTLLAPGTYAIVIRHADGVDKVALTTDQFVLTAI